MTVTEIFDLVLKTQAIGILLGFTLSAGKDYVNALSKARKQKRALLNELKSLKQQVTDKLDILDQMQEALKNSSLLSGISVRFSCRVYQSVIGDVLHVLTDKERNCLHVIYEYARVVDESMESFESAVKQEIAAAIVDEPKDALLGRLKDLKRTLGVMVELLDGYLAGNPADVFHLYDS